MGKSFIRASAFFRKELVEVLRQPRLILTLILGPFLILLLFGVGFKNEARPIPTLFVVDPKSPLAAEIEKNTTNISPTIIFAGVTADEADARQKLANGEVGLLVVAPTDPASKFKQNEQAEFTIYHNEIDPAQIGYIAAIGQDFVDEINRRMLSSLAAESQQESGDVRSRIEAARKNAAAMREALQAGDAVLASQHQRAMKNDISGIALVASTSIGLLNNVEQELGTSSQDQTQSGEILDLLASLEGAAAQGSPPEGQSDYSPQIAELQKTENDLATLEDRLSEFQSISPDVLVRPFKASTIGLSGHSFSPVDFFTPGVIILLLQHIAVSIASLSIVRERRSGTMELFRVSPISSAETLSGKYISYLLFGIVLSAILTLLLYFGLKMPMNGAWLNYAIVILLVFFASLGIGFLISLLADTESQAVQISMIVLLLSVFFSGFMLDLRYLWGPVQVVSWFLPATYGTQLLQSVMLRGSGLNYLYAGALLGIGIFLLLVSWILLRRRMSHD